MARFSLIEEADLIEVELGEGHVFVIREVTKHVGEKSRPIGRRIDEKVSAGTESGDEVVPMIGEYLDVMLKRTGNGDGPATKPSTLIRKLWEADKLSEDRLVDVFVFVATRGGAAGDDGPPT